MTTPTVTPEMAPSILAAEPVSMWSKAKILWTFRGLIYSLTLKEIKARYKHSVLGFLWSLLNPLGMMLVFTFVFGYLMRNGEIEKFPLFLLCGLLPWNYFTSSVMSGIHSVVGNGNLVKKVYFPREVLPIAYVLSNLVNFLLAFLLLFIALVVFNAKFSPWLWLLPVVVLMQTCFVVGLSLILSTLQVFYRDTGMVMDVALLAWFFVTPVFYSIDFIPRFKLLFGMEWDVHRWLYILNPMASLIRTYRDLLYWGYRTDLDFFLRTAMTCIVVLLFGYWFFNRFSGRFGEEV